MIDVAHKTELTEDERDQMAHCIGHASAMGCSVHGGRNHYCTDATDPLWCGLVDRGLAVMHRSPILPDDEAIFSLTDAGREALEADPRSQTPKQQGKRWSVRFRGYSQADEVVATTRGKAKYKAAREAAEAWNCSVFEAISQIESCTLGGCW